MGDVPPALMDAKRHEQLSAFAQSVGLQFEPAEYPLVNQALTHRSFAVEAEVGGDNERLEFLGDAVIGLAASRYIFEKHGDADEGRLSKIKAAVVSRKSLGACAGELGFGGAIRLGRGEARAGGSLRISTLGGALEALVGALFLLRGYEKAERWVRLYVLERCAAKLDAHSAEDFKSRLQEWTQYKYGTLPAYRKVGENGPDHRKTFLVEVLVEGEVAGVGTGSRLKDAEMAAAREACRKMIPGPAAKNQNEDGDKEF